MKRKRNLKKCSVASPLDEPIAADCEVGLLSEPEAVPREDEEAAEDGQTQEESGLEKDRCLAQRCVAGEVKAWEELYAQCDHRLRVSIRCLLPRSMADGELVDEIAARVWFALVDKDGKLLRRYDPQQGGRLTTFMRILAKDELCRHFRSELRRRKRELGALRDKPRLGHEDAELSIGEMEEFLRTLTPREHSFYREVLLGESGDAPPLVRSAANVWQLTHRVYQKFLGFLRLGAESGEDRREDDASSAEPHSSAESHSVELHNAESHSAESHSAEPHSAVEAASSRDDTAPTGGKRARDARRRRGPSDRLASGPSRLPR